MKGERAFVAARHLEERNLEREESYRERGWVGVNFSLVSSRIMGHRSLLGLFPE